MDWPPAGAVALGYLASYDERMGQLRVACVRQCACNATTLAGWHRQRTSIMGIGMVPIRPVGGGKADAPAQCTLRLEHQPSPQPPSARPRAASKFKLLAVVTPAYALDASDVRQLATGQGLI